MGCYHFQQGQLDFLTRISILLIFDGLGDATH
jgi:hypothetical protein